VEEIAVRNIRQSGRSHDRGWNVCEKCFAKFVSDGPRAFDVSEPYSWFGERPTCQFCGGTDELTASQVAFTELQEFVTEFNNAAISKEACGLPLFCEGYLYELLGKEDARSVLALMRKLAETLGMPLSI
jgi:hypothetical protein